MASSPGDLLSRYRDALDELALFPTWVRGLEIWSNMEHPMEQGTRSPV